MYKRQERTRAAYGIAELVTETMASAARVHAVENGKDMENRTLIAFGGAAPLHAARLAQKLGITRVVIPVGAGVGSAHGFLQAPISYEVVRSRLVSLAAYDADFVTGLFAEMRAEAESVVRLGAPNAVLHEERTAYMRYRGQGHEVRVPIPDTEFGPETLRQYFESVYRALYGRIIPRLEIEVVSWTLSLSEARSLPTRQPEVAAKPAPAPNGTRSLVDPVSGMPVDAQVYGRDALQPGAPVQGPAIIAEAETSTLVPQGFTAALNGAGHVVIERNVP